LADLTPEVGRKLAWELTTELEKRAEDAGAAGVILMGLKFDSVVGDAADNWLNRVE
jgi:hypothetical protein